MDCPKCGCETSVKESRDAFSSSWRRRTRKCERGHTFTTYEITAPMFNAARYAMRKKAKAKDYHQKISNRKQLAAEMRRERMRGVSCPELAKKHSLSIHMVRYYTRIPREKLYPAVKKRKADEEKENSKN